MAVEEEEEGSFFFTTYWLLPGVSVTVFSFAGVSVDFPLCLFPMIRA